MVNKPYSDEIGEVDNPVCNFHGFIPSITKTNFLVAIHLLADVIVTNEEVKRKPARRMALKEGMLSLA